MVSLRSLLSWVGGGFCRRWESNPHARKGRGILSPLRLPFRHSGTGWEKSIVGGPGAGVNLAHSNARLILWVDEKPVWML